MSSEHGPLADYAEKVVGVRQSLLYDQEALIEAWDRLRLLFMVALESGEGGEPDGAISRMLGTLEEVIVDVGNAAGSVGFAAERLGEATEDFAEAAEDRARSIQSLADEIEPVPRF